LPKQGPKKSKKGERELEELARLAVPLSQVLHRAVAAGELVESSGLPPRQLQALLVLRHEGPLPVGDLGRTLGIAASTATELADRLAAAGMAERTTEAHDRRKTLIAATRDGAKLSDSYSRKTEKMVKKRLEHLSAKERAELLASFRSIISLLGRTGGGR